MVSFLFVLTLFSTFIEHIKKDKIIYIYTRGDSLFTVDKSIVLILTHWIIECDAFPE